jgi:hypothetical protein
MFFINAKNIMYMYYIYIYIAICSCKYASIIKRTSLMPSCYGFSWFARSSRSSFIDSNYTEFISSTFVQILHCKSRIWCWIVICFYPFTAAFSLLNYITYGIVYIILLLSFYHNILFEFLHLLYSFF